MSAPATACAQCGVVSADHPAGDGLTTCPGDFPPVLTGEHIAEIVAQCEDALSDIIIERLAEVGFTPDTADAAETACYDAVARKLEAPANIADAAKLYDTDEWDDEPSLTIYLPDERGAALLAQQGWTLEPVPGGNAYVKPGHPLRAAGGKYGVDYLWDRAEAVRLAITAETMRRTREVTR